MLTKNYLCMLPLLLIVPAVFAQTAPRAVRTPDPVSASQPAGGPARAPASSAATNDPYLTVPLSEASKAGAIPKNGPVGAIQVIDDKNPNLKMEQGGQKAKPVREFELVRISDVEGKLRAMIKVRGVSSLVDVGSTVQKYTVASIDKESVCLRIGVKVSKGACQKTIKFESD